MSLHQLPASAGLVAYPRISPPSVVVAQRGTLRNPSTALRRQLPREKFVEVIVSNDVEQLSQYADLWHTLADNAVEPNVFYEHWSLLPAMRLLSEQDVRVLLVLERDPNAGMKSQLIGVFPLEQCKSFHRLPLGGMRLWRHPHCYLCNPLIARGHEEDCWKQLFVWLRSQRQSGHFFEMRTLRADGPLMQSFEAFCFAEQLPSYLSELYGRPMMEIGMGTGEDYLRANMGGDHRRGYARKKKQLMGKGELRFETLRPDEPALQSWIDDFLGVEGSGWKKQAATAMACHPADREYFRILCHEAHARHRLSLMNLTLAGRPIAAHMGISAGPGSFAIKIAYDESLGAYSPGVLLEIEAMHELHRTRPCQWVDSCSARNGLAMRRIWKQDRRIANVICPTGKRGDRLMVATLPLVQYLRNRVKRWLPRRPVVVEESA